MSGCTATQAAAALGISPDTLYVRCKKDLNQDFSAYCQEKRASGDKLIHQTQFEVACKNKNTTMLIWLGKQRLKQKENDDPKDAIPPQDAIVDRDNENMSLKAQLAKLQAQVDNITKARQELPGSDAQV